MGGLKIFFEADGADSECNGLFVIQRPEAADAASIECAELGCGLLGEFGVDLKAGYGSLGKFPSVGAIFVLCELLRVPASASAILDYLEDSE